MSASHWHGCGRRRAPLGLDSDLSGSDSLSRPPVCIRGHCAGEVVGRITLEERITDRVARRRDEQIRHIPLQIRQIARKCATVKPQGRTMTLTLSGKKWGEVAI